jgi:hypothetical protein
MIPTGSPGTVVAIQRKKIIRRFIASGAITYKDSKTLDEIGVRDSLIFKRLLRQGLINEAYVDRYYLDMERVQQDTAERRRVVTILVVLIALGFLAAGIYNIFFKG